VLRHRNFALYWCGQAVSLTGTWMQVLAQNWVIVGFTSSASVLGLLNFAGSFPMMLLTLVGGVVADHRDKRHILLVTQAIFMLTAFALAGLYLTHTLKLWHIFVLAVLNGISAAYDMPANQALTPELVEQQEIPQAIALNQSIFHGSRVIGPALAGVVIGALGTASAFIANGLSFVAVIASLLLIDYKPRSPVHPARSPLGAMREGLRYVSERSRLRVLMLLTMLTTMLVFPNHVILLPLYAKRILHVGAAQLGWLMGVSGCGALLGSLMLLGVPREQRVLRIGLGVTGIAVGMGILSRSHSIGVSCLGSFIASLSLSLAMGLSATITQEVVPNHLRGRVMSLNSLMFVGVLPIAGILMTSLADLIGIREELAGSAMLYALGGLWLLSSYVRSPEIHDYEEPAPEQEAGRGEAEGVKR
jgi:MFS family permease